MHFTMKTIDKNFNMETKHQSSERPFEFLKIYGITLLLALAGTTLLNMSPGKTLPPGQAVAEHRESTVLPEAEVPSASSLLPLQSVREFWIKYLP